MKGILAEFKGRKANTGWAIPPVNTIVQTNPDEFNEVLIYHPEGFTPNKGEIRHYELDESKTYVWVQVTELKIIR